MNPTLQDLQALARQAGEILRAGFGQHQHTELKGTIDIVTEIDKQSEAFLIDAITQRWPDHHIVAEESGGNDNHSEHTWYIDPIDGTTNFAHGVPIFGVSIAYAQAGQLKIGVVYNPISDELFSAQAGQGAQLNGNPIQVSQADALESSLLVTGFPYDRFTNPDNNLDNFTRLAVQARGMRRLGSAALDLCFIADGRVDGYWEVSLEPWDLAAGTLIAREAGAIVSNRHGEPEMLTPPYSVVAANPALHAKLLGEIQR